MTLEHLGRTHDPSWFAEAVHRARNGVQLLDERSLHGDAWRTHVSPLTLDMGHPSRDVLGQLYGSYYRGMCALFGEDWGDQENPRDPLTGHPVSRFGFSPFLEVSRFMLTDAWRHELWAMRTVGVPNS